MKDNFFGLIANEELCDYFTSSAKNNSLSHAYIFLGADGTGKHTLAHIVAAAANCENKSETSANLPCHRCNSCRKILEGISPDIMIIGREEKATVGVEAVRFIKNDVSTYPNDGDFKVYIIEDAHTMTKQAQNALLLTLEEPPPYVIFILLCEHTENILETIKSRAPIIRMKTPNKEEAISFLKENYPSAKSFINSSPEEFEQIYKASKGSVGKILDLIGSPEKKHILQNRALAQRLIESLAHHTLANGFSDILSMFAQKREERERLVTQFTEIQSALRDLMAVKKSDAPEMIFFTDATYAEELSYGFSTLKLLQIAESAEKARLSVLKNSNVKLTVINFLSDLV